MLNPACGLGLSLDQCRCFVQALLTKFVFNVVQRIFHLTDIEQVWQLLLLQGVLFGIGGGLLYMPVILYLPEWFSQRRGLATGIIFAGAGIGGGLH